MGGFAATHPNTGGTDMTPTGKRFRKRDAILTCLRQTHTHPSADWIYQQLKPQIPDLSLGTVYRNLTLFKEQGQAVSLGTVGGVERFDGFTHPHVHFVCRSCGSVQDLDNVAVPTLLDSAVGQVESCQLTFTGQCRECLEKEEKAV